MQRTTKLLAFAGLSLVGASMAQAGFTTIGPSLNPAEPTHADILGSLFGGTFTASGVDFTNSSVTATRVDDSFDTLWTDAGGPTEVSTNTSLPHTIGFADSKYSLARPGATFTSLPSDNVDGKDHQVTYLLSGAESGYLLFFEDGRGDRGGDFDFNDVVLASTGDPVLVPLPGALASGLVTMGVGMLIRRGRKLA